MKAAALLFVILLAGWAAGEQMERDDPIKHDFLRFLNEWRGVFELPQLFQNNKLMELAQRRADEMERKSEIGLDSEDGKSIAEEMNEAGYPVTRWTFDVAQGIADPKQALSVLVEDNGSRAHLRDSFVMEAGVGFSAEGGRWAVLLARRQSECGNGLLDAGEECDVGDTVDDECCSSECTIGESCDCYQPDDSPTTTCSRW